MITVVLATYNGGEKLRLTLESFTKLVSPPGGWKLVVVDNASTDATANILESFKNSLPLTTIYCGEPGKNAALNAAISQFEGDLVVNTDDDVIAQPHWLNMIETAARHYPNYAIFSGQVRHFWQKKPPTWLRQLAKEGRAFAGTDSERTAGEIPPDHVKGPNVVFRSFLYEQYRYPLGIGPDGSSYYAKGSETSLLRRLSADGYRIMYIPEAMVQHIVRPDQIGVIPVLSRSFQIGRGKMRLSHERVTTENPGPTIFGLPRHVYRLAAEKFAKSLWLRVRHGSYSCMCTLIDLHWHLGHAYEARQIRRERAHGNTKGAFRKG
jgi:hypothetical protein